MAQPHNPYAAPTSAVEDAFVTGDFVQGGRSVPSGNGWQWIVDGFHLFQRSPWIWIVIMLLLVIISAVLSRLGGFGSLILVLITPVLSGGVMLGCDALMRGEPLQVGHLFAAFRAKTGPLMLVGVLTLVGWLIIVLIVGLLVGFSMFSAIMAGSAAGSSLLAAGALTMMLSFLLALALSVPLVMAIWFAPALVVFHDLSATDALKNSFSGCLKNIVPYLVYGILILIFGILATIPFALGWFVWGPTLFASVYASYRDVYLQPVA